LIFEPLAASRSAQRAKDWRRLPFRGEREAASALSLQLHPADSIIRRH
jgi:hypothetical protein